MLVHDAGTIINPLLADANLHGGIAQGIGGAMYEKIAYDESAQPLTATFMDYTIPTAVEMPNFELGHQETPSPFTPLGTKGVGESGVGAPLGALCSAIENALPELDLRLTELPLTPEPGLGGDPGSAGEARREREGGGLMLAKEFDFHAPEDVEAALGLLGGGGIVKVLAGGMSLVPAMNLGLLRPDAIVSLNHVQGLDYVDDDGDRRRIGAMVRHERLADGSSDPRGTFRLSPTAASLIGDVQIRHRGTIGGSLSPRRPGGRLPPGHDRSRRDVHAAGAGRASATSPAREFFVDIMLTDLRRDELVVEVGCRSCPRAPAPPTCGSPGSRAASRSSTRRPSSNGGRPVIAIGGATGARCSSSRTSTSAAGSPRRPWSTSATRRTRRARTPTATSTAPPSTGESWRASTRGVRSRRRWPPDHPDPEEEEADADRRSR